MYSDFSNGIHFIEGVPAGARCLAPVSTRIDGLFTDAQLGNLDDVKAVLAQEARRRGGNAVVDFRYGQKQVSFWRSLLSLDDVCWEASGTVAVIDPASPSD